MISESSRKRSSLIIALLALCLAAATVLPAASASDGPTASIAKKKCKKKGKHRALAAKKKCKKKKQKEEIPASIVATPASYDFGVRAPDERGIPAFTFTLTNPGDRKVDALYMTFGGTGTFIGDLTTGGCSRGILPNGTCLLPVEFLAGSEPGPVNGTITLDDHKGASVTLALSATIGG